MGDGSAMEMEKRRQWRATHGGLDSVTVMDIADVKGDAMAMERCNGNDQCKQQRRRCPAREKRNRDGRIVGSKETQQRCDVTAMDSFNVDVMADEATQWMDGKSAM